MRYDCGGYSLEVPDGWFDTTEGESSPFTLARAEGVGALQLSVALYNDGLPPNASSNVLREMLEEFAQTHTLGSSFDLVAEEEPVPLAAASFFLEEGQTFLRSWFVSDGLSFAKITYVCAKADLGPEVNECEKIVRSIEFTATGA
jgi:hypothetical protein